MRKKHINTPEIAEKRIKNAEIQSKYRENAKKNKTKIAGYIDKTSANNLKMMACYYDITINKMMVELIEERFHALCNGLSSEELSAMVNKYSDKLTA